MDRGLARRTVSETENDLRILLALLAWALCTGAIEIQAYFLMTTHYHLVLETPLARLSRAMHRLNTAYAQRFNRRHDRRGHLFESRFSSWVIRDDGHLGATCEYVLGNPVRAGVSDAVGDWPWAGAALLSGDATICE